MRRSKAWSSHTKDAGNGSVRVRIYFTDLAWFNFLCPDLDEQRAISDVLEACDEELRILDQQRDAIERQRRGLMQRLLTGQIRVRTP